MDEPHEPPDSPEPPEPTALLDPVDVLATRCVRLVAVDGGSVALLSSSGDRVVRFGTDGTAQSLEDCHTELGEGPYVDAGTAMLPVLVPDLRASAERWPFFQPRALDLGVAAIFTFPIRVSSLSVATLGLYRGRPGLLDAEHVELAMSTAEQLGVVLVETKEERPQPEAAVRGIADSARLHQAAGMVTVQAGVSISEAIALMRATAYAEGVELSTVARQVVERERRVTKGVRDE